MQFSVKVDRTECAGALRMLTTFIKRKQPVEAVLTLTDRLLRIDLPGNGVSMPADGQWNGVVRVPGHFLVVLVQALPTVDPLPIYVRDGRLYVDRQSVQCSVQEASDERIELLLNASLVDILCTRLNHSDEEIERSGLTPLVRKAEAHRDATVAKAYDLLLTLNVRQDDLRSLVDESIRRSSR